MREKIVETLTTSYYFFRLFPFLTHGKYVIGNELRTPLGENVSPDSIPE